MYILNVFTIKYIYIHVRKLRGEKVKKKSQEVRNDSGGKKVNKKIHVSNT